VKTLAVAQTLLPTQQQQQQKQQHQQCYHTMLHQRLLQSVWGKVLRADTADIVSSAEANNASN